MFSLIVLTHGGVGQIRLVSPHHNTRLHVLSSSGCVIHADTRIRRPGVHLEWDEPPTEPVVLSLDGQGFSFWADQVTTECPIILRSLQVVITLADDSRSYASIVENSLAKGGRSALTEIQTAPEDSYDEAANRNRQLQSPTWLGISRDMRTFGFSFRGIGAGRHSERLWDWIAPQFHGQPVRLGEADDRAVRYQFMIGRGIGPRNKIRRRLMEGRLPILEAWLPDGGVSYDITAFVSFERCGLKQETNQGTDFLLADGNSAGHMFTVAQLADFERLAAAFSPSEELVLFLRVQARNTMSSPRFAYLRLPAPYVGDDYLSLTYSFDTQTGLSSFSPDRVFCTATINGLPLNNEEKSCLLQPGETVTFDVRIPHQPIPAMRAQALGLREYDETRTGCADFWRAKLRQSASVEVPEARVAEMFSAGLLHLDLIAYGHEPEGTLAPTIGAYAPIGSESAPIIQFFDSVGRSDLAKRSLQYFLDKQHEDGFMQNYNGYMLETEATLWSMGEHFRYTRDLEWVRGILPNLTAAVGYILRNRREQSDNPQSDHGLLAGKTADPDDVFESFMLNGYAFLGLSRAAEMMADLDAQLSREWELEADALREDIRKSFLQAVSESPVVPLADGSWVRSAPPWPNQPGPLALDRGDKRWFTHGAFTPRDTLLGPLWLVFQEVLDPDEITSDEILAYQSDIFFEDNTALSQPYYSPHPLIHLRRGEVKPFLRAYYTMVAGLADPETYSFWEHYFHASPHKTHEEAWFLMQTRWMLYLEKGDELRLFPGIPRAWLFPGGRIRLNGVRSYFGELDASLDVGSDGSSVSIRVVCDPGRAPRVVTIRVPHPSGRIARSISTGVYDAHSEVISVNLVAGKASLRVGF